MSSADPAAAVFFPDAPAFRAWLSAHHADTPELFVGFHKKSSGRGGLTYPEAVDEALCFGWIDGVMKSLGPAAYRHRFTPRKPSSIWSNVNVAHVARLTAAGKMAPAGLAAFAARRAEKTGVYVFESKSPLRLPADYARRFKAHAAAWTFFSAQAPWYRRQILHKIIRSKQPATRERWLARAIAASSAGRRLA